MLLTVLISGSAYASGNGYAVGTNSTANGPGSYATSINGVATGHNAIATGEGMSREQFTERRKAVEDIERQLGEKQNEINTIDAQISSVQSLIDSIERRITDINQRQTEVARLIERRTALQNQKKVIQDNLIEQQNQLQQANNAYNRLSKDSSGNSIYVNYDNVFNKLDWKKLDEPSGNGRNELTTDIKAIIEADFPELKGSFTDLQYKELIDGYVARNVTADVSAQYLNKVIKDNLGSQIQDNGDGIYILSKPSVYRNLFRTKDDLELPNELPKFNTDYGFYLIGGRVAQRADPSSVKELKSLLYFYFSAKVSGTNSHHIINNYQNIRYDHFERLPPVNRKYVYSFSSNLFDNRISKYSIENVLSGEKSYVDRFISTNKSLKDFLTYVDYSNNNWWFDLSDYKLKMDRIIEFNDAVEDFLNLQAKLKTELSKPLSEQNKIEIDRINKNLLIRKEFIDKEKSNEERYFSSFTLEYKNEVIKKDFSTVQHIMEELYNQTRDHIRTYDENNPVIKATREKSKELKQAVTDAQNKVNRTQNDIDQLIEQISRLGLSPDDETLADRKREQEQLLNQRRAELEKQNEDLATKQAELAQLNQQLANSPIKNIGKNSLAEGANAFASGENAIAYGANTLATGNNAVALGNEAQATAENAVAFGSNAMAKGINSVALGAGSLAVSENEVSVGVGKNDLGRDEFTRKITNVTAGEAGTDAVNVSQLKEVKDQIQAVDTKIDTEISNVNTRIDGVDQKVDTEIGKVNTRIDGVDQKVDTEISKVNTRIDGVAQKVDTEIGNVNTRIDGVAEKVNIRIDGVAQKVDAEISKVNTRIDGVDQKVDTEIGKVNTRIDGVAQKVDTEIGKVNTRIDGVAQKVDAEIGKVKDKIASEVGKVDTKANNLAKVLGASVTADGLVEVEYNYYQGGEKKTVNDVKSALSGISENSKHFNAKTNAEQGSKATGEESVAMGGNSEALGRNSVAVGSNSKALGENEFAVGNAELELTRRITQVSDGLAKNDAVNKGQLDGEAEKVNVKLTRVAEILGATVTTDGLLTAEYDYYEKGQKKTTNNVKTALNAAAQNTKYVSVNSTGNSAKAEGAESVAIGANSVAKGSNSVAVGTGSVAMSDNEFSVGNANVTRRITNVAEGVSETDAVNMGQFTRGMNALGGQVNQLENKIARTEKRMSSGIAGAYAAASLINAPGAGDSMLSVGTGTFNGATAVALGYSRVSDNGKVSLKLIGSASNKGDVGGGASVGFKF
ncbi:YadA-like family protein [Mannheimia pernigra]|uniref:YadA-like family protein n=1 Tax=Mannheimia pernigra TaxID=111844 RepID=UPI00159F3E06|nr:YadA-like family protein [Mannheimia pernigra]QLB43991.1 YadA-like family protein [Mannheimia pernigra]